MSDQQCRFGLNCYEAEDYDEKVTKNLFEVKNIEKDCPILWISVDPEFEYLRKVKISQSKNNWLYQLLLAKDNISKIEACKALANFNEGSVYSILDSTAKNESLFFKVRKAALKALGKIQLAHF